jgi:lipopolysaccharide export system protein LptA
MFGGALLVGMACVHLADAADATPEQAAQNDIVQVTADRMVSDARSDQVVFTGNVEAHRSGLYVKADRLEVKQDRATKKMAQMVAIGLGRRNGVPAGRGEHDRDRRNATGSRATRPLQRRTKTTDAEAEGTGGIGERVGCTWIGQKLSSTSCGG